MAYRHPRLPRKPEPHIALWMLRLLASPTGLPLFVTKHGFASDRLAYALDLDHWIDPQDRTFDPQARESYLAAMKTKGLVESDPYILPSAGRPVVTFSRKV